MTTRPDLFSRLPETKADALELLREFKRHGLEWHFDDDPFDIWSKSSGYLSRVFSDDECRFLVLLGDRLNDLFADEIPADERNCPNAGAWQTVGQCGWLEVQA